MKVVYNFIYSDSDGKIQEFKMPVSITEEIDADTMYDLCLSYLEVGKVKGTPLHAVSTSGKYPNYCFTSTACDAECETCRSKKLNGKSAQAYEPQSLEGKKIYIYEGKFGKVGAFSRRIIQKSYLLPAPALLTDNLIGDFKAAMNKEKDGMGWELLGITLVHELDPQGMTDKEIEQYVKTPEGNLFQSDSEEKLPEEKMIWARISDENENRTAWVPALIRGEQVLSAVGELDSPDNPEDTREFIDCPIPGYRVVKNDTDPKELGLARIACAVYPLDRNDKREEPFLYINEFIIPIGLSNKDAVKYLMELAQKFIKGNCEIEPLYWEYLSFLNGEKLATAHVLDERMKPADLATPHFLVSYTVNEEEGREYTCVVRYPVRITSPIMMIPAGAYVAEKLKKYFGDKVSITQMDYFDDVVSSLAVIL